MRALHVVITAHQPWRGECGGCRGSHVLMRKGNGAEEGVGFLCSHTGQQWHDNNGANSLNPDTSWGGLAWREIGTCSLGVLPYHSFITKEIYGIAECLVAASFFRVTTVEPSPQTLNDNWAQQGGTWHGGLLKMLSIVSSANPVQLYPEVHQTRAKKSRKGKLQTVSYPASVRQSYSHRIRCRFTSLIPFLSSGTKQSVTGLLMSTTVLWCFR